MEKRLEQILLDYHTELLELFLGVYAFTFGVWLLLPFQTFTSTSSYEIMQRLASEWIWGMAAASIGAVQIVSVVWMFAWGRKWDSLLATFFWSVIGITFLLSNWSSTGGALFSLMALIEGFIHIRSWSKPHDP